MTIFLPDPEPRGPSVPSLETKMQRVQTKAFIEADPLQVTLLRSERVSNGSGGFRWSSPISLPPQDARLLPTGYKVSERQTREGQKVEPDSVLLMEHDADLERWDQFVLDGITYEVVWVRRLLYEVKADVTALRGGT